MSDKTVTLLLEAHGQSGANDYLTRQDNIGKFLNADFAVELTSKSPEISFQDERSFDVFIESFRGSYNHDHLLNLIQLKKSFFTSCFLVDSFYETYSMRVIFDMYFSPTFILNWLREREIARNIVKILTNSPRNNLILILGAFHFSVFYHLLMLLPTTPLDVYINILNLQNEIPINELNPSRYFYLDDTMVQNMQNGDILSLPPLETVTNKTHLAKEFMMHPQFASFQHSYQEGAKKIESYSRNIFLAKNCIRRFFAHPDSSKFPNSFIEYYFKSTPELKRLSEEFFAQPTFTLWQPYSGSELFRPTSYSSYYAYATGVLIAGATALPMIYNWYSNNESS